MGTRTWEQLSCEDLAARLVIPEPWNFRTFIDAINPNRRIELIPVSTQPGKPCGLLVSTDRADYICYAANTTPLHQLHIQCHEMAHLLRGHTGAAALDAQLAGAMMPSLPASVIERVLGRTVYSADDEHDAELLASLIMRRIGHARRPQRTERPDVVTTLTRLSFVFGSHE
jgi:hypothetical protein